jgi:hypothetical protein
MLVIRLYGEGTADSSLNSRACRTAAEGSPAPSSVDVADVGVDRVHGDVQLPGDLRPGEVGREISQNPKLTAAELRRRRLRVLARGGRR